LCARNQLLLLIVAGNAKRRANRKTKKPKTKITKINHEKCKTNIFKNTFERLQRFIHQARNVESKEKVKQKPYKR